MPPLELIATTAFGLESVVARELTELGYTDQRVEDGRVTFTADEVGICRTNLWLRAADRVLLKVGSFEARDFGELFERTKALPWADLLPRDAKFPVEGKSVRSQLHHVPSCQSIVKKAIVESLKPVYQRARFEESGAEFAVEVSILKDEVLLTIDTSGEGLHKRGYRQFAGPAPLRETLAAALVLLSYWNPERQLIDPFCGTGTIPIEAALIGRNRAPGLGRNFPFQDWPLVPKETWIRAREEAKDLAKGRLPLRIVGTDIDPRAVNLANQHARLAGVDTDVLFQQKSLSDFDSDREYGCVICNPPYGERLGDRTQAAAIYQEMSEIFPEEHATWSVYVLTAHQDFERIYGRPADRRRKLYNGRIECTYYQYLGPPPPKGMESSEVESAE